jgi:hypothetical protein
VSPRPAAAEVRENQLAVLARDSGRCSARGNSFGLRAPRWCPLDYKVRVPSYP